MGPLSIMKLQFVKEDDEGDDSVYVLFIGD